MAEVKNNDADEALLQFMCKQGLWLPASSLPPGIGPWWKDGSAAENIGAVYPQADSGYVTWPSWNPLLKNGVKLLQGCWAGLVLKLPDANTFDQGDRLFSSSRTPPVNSVRVEIKTRDYAAKYAVINVPAWNALVKDLELDVHIVKLMAGNVCTHVIFWTYNNLNVPVSVRLLKPLEALSHKEKIHAIHQRQTKNINPANVWTFSMNTLNRETNRFCGAVQPLVIERSTQNNVPCLNDLPGLDRNQPLTNGYHRWCAGYFSTMPFETLAMAPAKAEKTQERKSYLEHIEFVEKNSKQKALWKIGTGNDLDEELNRFFKKE